MEVLRRTFTTLRRLPFHDKETAVEYYVELKDYYPRLKDWYLTAEPETYQWLMDNVRNNWTCIEVGAHIGEASMLLSKLAKVVFSFEASRKTCEMFMNNIEHNQKIGNGQFVNVQLIPRPVGNYTGLQAEKLWLTGKDDQFGETTGEFDFITLDTFVNCRNDVSWVNLIFMDADGWDYDVLLGADFIVNKCHPYIIMEANYALKWRGHKMDDVYNWASLKNYDCKFLDANCPGNVLLIPIINHDNSNETIYVRE